jgi:hypothetical protein
MLERGQVYIPPDSFATWVGRYVSELVMWTGDEKETADQVDCSSMAALEVYEKPLEVRSREYAVDQEIDEIMTSAISAVWSWR